MFETSVVHAEVVAEKRVGLLTASFAFHAAAAQLGVIARALVEPTISVDWSVVWASRAQSGAIAGLLESARRCSEEKSWLRVSTEVAGATSR